MTDTNRYYEKPPALTLSLVYKLMELERIEMDRRVAEKRRHISKFKVSSLVGFDGGGKKIPRLSTAGAVSKGNYQKLPVEQSQGKLSLMTRALHL